MGFLLVGRNAVILIDSALILSEKLVTISICDFEVLLFYFVEHFMKLSFYTVAIVHSGPRSGHVGGVNRLPSEETVAEEAALEPS